MTEARGQRALVKLEGHAWEQVRGCNFAAIPHAVRHAGQVVQKPERAFVEAREKSVCHQKASTKPEAQSREHDLAVETMNQAPAPSEGPKHDNWDCRAAGSGPQPPRGSQTILALSRWARVAKQTESRDGWGLAASSRSLPFFGGQESIPLGSRKEGAEEPTVEPEPGTARLSNLALELARRHNSAWQLRRAATVWGPPRETAKTCSDSVVAAFRGRHAANGHPRVDRPT